MQRQAVMLMQDMPDVVPYSAADAPFPQGGIAPKASGNLASSSSGNAAAAAGMLQGWQI
jgi:hypothetical protein